MNPFVFGTVDALKCFDEEAPCILEQTSMCVIELAQKEDTASKFPGQDKYVPWVVCMDTNKDAVEQCHKEVGIDSAAVKQCLKNDAPALLKKYLATDASIHGTPTVYVNGKQAKNWLWQPCTSYVCIKRNICRADSTVSGCSVASPLWGTDEYSFSNRTESVVV